MTKQLEQLGRYKIRGVIGRGAMGVVYKGYDPTLARWAAVKTVSASILHASEDKTFERRFLNEARAVAGLSHPGILVIYEITRDDSGILFMALEYLEGQTVEAQLAGGEPIQWTRALTIVQNVADALHHAHQHGVIHRDVKPANIMLLPSGDVKLMDFGVAKVSAVALTSAGQMLGSPAYMSPEQTRGDELDARSDVFSLGAVLYELVTGRRAFAGRSVPQIVVAVATQDPPPPSSVNPELPPEVDVLVRSALAKRKEDRLAGAELLASEIRSILSPPTAPVADATRVAGIAAASLTRRSGAQTPGLPPGKRVSLAVVSGPDRGQTFRIAAARASIGRKGGDADIQVNDPEISRAHAALSYLGGRFELQDLNSTNGTFVDDQRIEARTLEDQDEFRIGESRFVLVVADEEPV